MAAARIYLDWNATAPLMGAAREAMLDALSMPGNPSSVHAEGRAARAVIEKARREVAHLVGAEPAHVTFTASATEAANQVLSPIYRMGKSSVALGRLYVSAIEHPAVRAGGRFSADQVTEVPVTRSGILDVDALAAQLASHDPADGLPLVAVMLVNNETGIIQPIREISATVKKFGGLLVVDAVQAAGRIPLSIADLGADFLILSAHKLGGPKGVGALVSRGETLMPEPLVRGGGQEKGHRAGTENLAAVTGFGASAFVMTKDLVERNAAIAALRDKVEAGMLAAAPDTVIYGRGEARVGNTSFFHLPGLKAETGQIAFDLEGIALSAGAACSSGKVGASHVLTAMGEDASTGALRLSIGPDTTESDIDRFLGAFVKIAARRKPAGQAA
ncbi:aminotransferase class V-fold PLP-dependent enzyme [Agrobacterium sp. MA01]|uniref:cysteine desulfurase family protein n=1 Tax=Agrobacterium sp. MA01 TaxID=2664893 RepID=UPI00129AE9FC|nr:cysteine desulfurase family protein [Agrobacterium sp. MA01]QGG90368.1 aminotransferase class V-fold PLP-dependent enzyme [Agrobacterium sp. MA01]